MSAAISVPTVEAVLAEAEARLASARVETPRADAEWLLAGILDVALPFEQLAQPAHVVLVPQPVGVGPGAGVLLVLPVGGDAVLGATVLGEGADLHLDRLALRADDRRVERLYMLNFGIET